MGYYINQASGFLLPAIGKVQFLIDNAYAKVISSPKEFVENLVCVVDNGHFEAAGYAYSKEEMEAFAYPDGRNKTWLIVPYADILSGYK